MKRVLRVLLLALFLGPQFGEILLPPDLMCAETEDCCTPDGACSATCVACGCCGSWASNIVAETTAELLGIPREKGGIASTAEPLPPPPTEILHVPKSLTG